MKFSKETISNYLNENGIRFGDITISENSVIIEIKSNNIFYGNIYAIEDMIDGYFSEDLSPKDEKGIHTFGLWEYKIITNKNTLKSIAKNFTFEIDFDSKTVSNYKYNQFYHNKKNYYITNINGGYYIATRTPKLKCKDSPRYIFN